MTPQLKVSGERSEVELKTENNLKWRKSETDIDFGLWNLNIKLGSTWTEGALRGSFTVFATSHRIQTRKDSDVMRDSITTWLYVQELKGIEDLGRVLLCRSLKGGSYLYCYLSDWWATNYWMSQLFNPQGTSPIVIKWTQCNEGWHCFH